MYQIYFHKIISSPHLIKQSLPYLKFNIIDIDLIRHCRSGRFLDTHYNASVMHNTQTLIRFNLYKLIITIINLAYIILDTQHWFKHGDSQLLACIILDTQHWFKHGDSQLLANIILDTQHWFKHLFNFLFNYLFNYLFNFLFNYLFKYLFNYLFNYLFKYNYLFYL